MPPEHLTSTIAGIATRSAPSQVLPLGRHHPPPANRGCEGGGLPESGQGSSRLPERAEDSGLPESGQRAADCPSEQRTASENSTKNKESLEESRYSRGTTCGGEPRKWVSGAPERKDQSSTLLKGSGGSEDRRSRSRRERKAGKTGRGTIHAPIQRLCGGPCTHTTALRRAMYPNSGFAAHFGSNLSQKGCLVLFVLPEKGRPTLRLRKCPVQRKAKSAGKRLRSTKQPLCDSFSSGNVGKGVFGASRFAFLNRGRLAPKQSKNTSGARPERRCGLRECDLGRGATQMPVRNERAQAQGTITADPLLASPPPEIAPPCARRATNRPSRTASQGGWAPARRARIEPASPGT